MTSKSLHCVLLAVLALSLFSSPQAEAAGFQVRLLTPVASYSANGTLLRAEVMGPVLSDRDMLLPQGTIIEGSVERSAPVGLGLKRERGWLELSFRTCELPSGVMVDCSVHLLSVDNARENVSNSGRIMGVLAAGNAYSWFGGVWYRPANAFSQRSAAGLTGAGGRIQHTFLPTPFGAAFVIGARLVVFRLPEPEIVLPAGTELIVDVSSELPAAGPDKASTSKIMSDQMARQLADLPANVTFSDGKPATDLVNLVFKGSAEDLKQAFAAAGWTGAEPLSARSAARTYAAYAGMRAYKTAPVSTMLYEKRPPELVFQKSFNSVAKRHHIRLWSLTVAGETVWLGAATHDTAIAFESSRMSFTHQIDLHIDLERQKVINDLRHAGCVAEASLLPRPKIQDSSLVPDLAITDGSAVVALLQDCTAATERLEQLPPQKRLFGALIARRLVLEGRHYIMRGNAYYWGYKGARRLFRKRLSTTDSQTLAKQKDPDPPQAPPSESL